MDVKAVFRIAYSNQKLNDHLKGINLTTDKIRKIDNKKPSFGVYHPGLKFTNNYYRNFQQLSASQLSFNFGESHRYIRTQKVSHVLDQPEPRPALMGVGFCLQGQLMSLGFCSAELCPLKIQ
jgi:hypothetical protein